MPRSAQIVGNLRGLTIPSTGIYVGAEDQDPGRNFTGTKGIETQLNRRMAIRRQHYDWLVKVPTAFETNNKAQRTPRVVSMIGMEGRGGATGFPVVGAGAPSANTATVNGKQGMDRITAGEYDTSYFVPCAQGIRDLLDPVFVNLWFEFNGAHSNYYAGWQGTIGGAVGTQGTGELRYVNAFRHVVNLFRAQGANNAIFVWCAQGPSTSGHYQNYYPGDQYVDVIAMDLYRATFQARCTNPGTFSGGTGSQDYYLFAQGTALTGPQATTLGRANGVVKPFMIAEAGYREGQTFVDPVGAGGDGLTYDKVGDQPGSHGAVGKLLQDLKDHPNVIGYVHWNEAGDPALAGTGNYIDAPAAALPRYQNFYNDPYCQVFFTGNTGPVPVAPTHGTPLISDTTPQQGQVLSADPNPSSWDGTTPITFSSYQWYREDLIDVDGVHTLQPIGGATSQTYTTVAGDVGHRIKVSVLGTGPGGSLRAFSAETGAVTATGSGSLSTAPTPKTPGFYSSAWTQTLTHEGRYRRTAERNGVIYHCGEWDHVVDNSSGSPVDRTNTPYLCAENAATGAIIQTWVPNPDNFVQDIKLSADGTKLFVVGQFGTIAGGTRSKVAVLPTLTGPTDTSAASLSSVMANLNPGGNVWRILLDEANNRAWIGGESGMGYVKRLGFAAGAWTISGGFTPGTPWSSGGGSAGPNIRAIALVGGNILVGGQNINPTLRLIDGNTGAVQTWNYQPVNTPGTFELLYDGTVVYIAGGDDAGDMLFACNASGGGPNSLVHGNGTNNGYWFHDCDGNVQCAILATINGQAVVVYGHHGDNAASVKNQVTRDIKSAGIMVLKAGTTGGDPIGYGTPPSFTRTVQTASPLKLFALYQDVNLGLHCGGDFSSVNSFAANVFRRYARFANSASGVPVNTAIPTLDNPNPVVGDTIGFAGTGTWTNTPTTLLKQIITKDSNGNETVVASGTGTVTYVIQSSDFGHTMIGSVIASNGTGSSTPARTNPSGVVATNPTAPSTPTLDTSIFPPNPTQIVQPTFEWTEAGTWDHFRYRLTQDGIVGAWVNTTQTAVTVQTAAGHSWVFEVQAVGATGLNSASDSYSWTVTATGTPLAPTITTKPAASSAARSVAFVVTSIDASVGYKWEFKLDTPAGAAAAFDAPSTVPIKNYPGPLAIGSYTFHARALNAAGVRGPEATWAFSITAAAVGKPDAPAFTSYPAAEDTDDIADFSWG